MVIIYKGNITLIMSVRKCVSLKLTTMFTKIEGHA